MLDELFARMRGDLVEPAQPQLMAGHGFPADERLREPAVEIRRITVCDGRVLSQQQRDIRPQRHFDALDRIEGQQAKLLVKHIEIDDLAKLGARPEIIKDGADTTRIGDGRCPQWIPITAQTIVPDPLERGGRTAIIGDCQPACLEQGQLGGNPKVGFGERLHQPAIK
jgi:hypothetical protein